MAQSTVSLEVTNDHAVPVQPLLGGTATILNQSGGTLFYADNSQVSSSNSQGSLTAAQSAQFASLVWIRSVSLSTVLVTLDKGPGGRWLSFTRPGVLAVETGNARMFMPSSCSIVSVAAQVATAPTGAAVIIDLLKNGVSVFTTQANRPTIAAGASASSIVGPDITSLASGDFLTLNIAQVGSTVAGADLAVVLVVQ